MSNKNRPKRFVVKKIEQVQTVKVNFWGMIQNSTIHAMNKGQLPGLALAGLLALIIYRVPEKDVGLLLHRILDNFGTAKGAAYILVAVLPVAWFFHARWQRFSIATEMDRIGREKTQLQEQLTRLNLASANKKGPQK